MKTNYRLDNTKMMLATQNLADRSDTVAEHELYNKRTILNGVFMFI